MTGMPIAVPANSGRARDRRWLVPSIEVMVLAAAAALVIASALIVAARVAQQIEKAAEEGAVNAMQAVVTAYVQPLLSMDRFASPDAATAASVNHQLELLTASGKILRIKIWTADGTVTYSDLPELRGQTFPVAGDLAEALAGEPQTQISEGTAQENLFEHGLASKLIEVYIPITPHPGGAPIGAYEIYQDAADLIAVIDASRQDVFLISGGIGLILMLVLYATLRAGNRMLGGLKGHLRSSEERFRSMVQNSSDLILMLDADGIVTYVSPAIERIAGKPPEAWTGHQLVELVHRDEARWVDALIERLAGAAVPITDGAVRVAHADGRWRWLELVGTNLLGDPAVGAIVLNCRDVTDRRSLEEQLRYQASHDPLTKLANRSLLSEHIEHELAAPRSNGRRHLAVLMLDIDNFKSVNDSVGHLVGDRLLIALAERLRGTVKKTDTAACLGGDKFALLVSRAESGEINVVAEQVMAISSEPIVVDGRTIAITLSLGIAFANGVPTTPDELLNGADIAMHLAKGAGKGRSMVFEPGMQATAIRLVNMQSDLAHALAHGQFSLRYQPTVELATAQPIGVEALLRWEHPDGLLMPTEFIPVAERSGLIVPIGRWVLEEACRTMVEMEGRFPNRVLRLGVNVSTVQLARPEFSDEVADALQLTGFDATRLTLELTESTVVDRAGPTIDVMRRLRELGVRLAVDDFGTGYSALSYLRDLPLDALKIDRSFVVGLGHDDEAPAVVRSILNLAGTFGLFVMAEGIESAEQAAQLRSLGAQYGQGFYYAEPLTADELAEYLDESSGSLVRAAS